MCHFFFLLFQIPSETYLRTGSNLSAEVQANAKQRKRQKLRVEFLQRDGDHDVIHA